MTTQRRREEIARFRGEGYDAAMDGRPLESNPYLFMDASHWSRGWMEGHDELTPPSPFTPEQEERILELIDKKLWEAKL
jgi:ribosome modulation factor